MGHISATSEELLDQATPTAQRYLSDAVNIIDCEFGKGFAKNNPNLVAAFMQVAASDMNNATLAKAQSEAIEVLAAAIESLGYKIESLAPA